jgi:hypothetical protein
MLILGEPLVDIPVGGVVREVAGDEGPDEAVREEPLQGIAKPGLDQMYSAPAVGAVLAAEVVAGMREGTV